MLRILLVAVALFAPSAGVQAGVKVIHGAGATFPYPLYAHWAREYYNLTGVKLNYQSIGSGGGIAQIRAGTVDFGASDAPLRADELEEAGLIQFPMIVGGVVLVVNLPGVGPGELRLTPEILADIFLAKITRWDDPRLQEVNPGLRLPKKQITVVHRADGSGTTWIFTNYLDKVSPEWHEKVGTGKAVKWPTGIGGKGNEGVSAYVQRVKGAIGYVEYAYAVQSKMSYTLLKNRAGNFVAPTIESFQAAAAHADWQNAPGFYMVLTDQPGENSWPITGASFILIHSEQKDCGLAETMLRFFDWSYRHGAEAAVKLHYVPIPANVVDIVEKTWAEKVTCDGESIWPVDR